MRRIRLTARLCRARAPRLTWRKRYPGAAGDDARMHSWDFPSGARDAAGPVARIVYVSRATITHSPYQEMERIRACAVRHNMPAGVATALLYQCGWFLQWKEGPGDAVQRIMDRVAADPRHAQQVVLHASSGPRLLAGPWSMAIVQCGEPPERMEQRVQALRSAAVLGRQLAPAAVWRCFSTPVRHHGKSGDDASFQRLLVCAAAGTDSFTLVQWLARRYGEELVHRRFAGADTPDVAADCVDIPFGDTVLRASAMARNGLRLPLTRAFVSDYEQAVLLLSGDEFCDGELVRRLAQACAGLVAPTVLAVAADPEWHRRARGLARRHGLAYVEVQANPSDPAECWQVLAPLLERWREAPATRRLA